METKFNFKSAVCTSRVQSERLLALGLKKETADMYYSYDIICAKPYYKIMEFMNGCVPEDIFPAWSLHRLMILAEMKGTAFSDLDTAYETTISIIAAKIRFGYFNKEYLV
jgi:hypothetical protein